MSRSPRKARHTVRGGCEQAMGQGMNERTGSTDARLELILLEHELVVDVLDVRQVEIRLRQQQCGLSRVHLAGSYAMRTFVRRPDEVADQARTPNTWEEKRPSQTAFCASQSTR